MVFHKAARWMAAQAEPGPVGSHRSIAGFHGCHEAPVTRDVEANWGAQCPVFKSVREGIVQ